MFSLGSFAPNEAKRFDVSFTYTFGDNRVGTEGATTSFFGYTVSPIPEPETFAMFLAGLGWWLQWRVVGSIGKFHSLHSISTIQSPASTGFCFLRQSSGELISPCYDRPQVFVTLITFHSGGMDRPLFFHKQAQNPLNFSDS